MKAFDIKIFYPAVEPRISLVERMEVAAKLLSEWSRHDEWMKLEHWLVATGDKEGSFRYPVFEGGVPGTSALAYYREFQRNHESDDPRYLCFWNGQLQKGVRASFTDQYNHLHDRPEIIWLTVGHMERWPNPSSIVDALKESAKLFAPRAMFVKPASYTPVFFDKPCVAWMLYLPLQLSTMQVPEAARLEPVQDASGRLIGTIIISVVDAIFDIGNTDHVRIAHDIEVRLTDQDLLPRYPDLLLDGNIVS
ncbi:hypothetical protein Hrubri_2178 [Herbaspirillum rubrisubalbicans M1]|uniref:Imm52 family immunity protein n=1 Tax=Herbaspirillum rubrisubalbicans TaxID=80842 RepID=UPI000739F7D7|nr:Imm52 family immunity protein [Herbaspirillum rubrisubalbicans]ALU89369.1 hypothetical protein Hrubri_2178 [Herbaspirillum rubrisubalbicans M1]